MVAADRAASFWTVYLWRSNAVGFGTVRFEEWQKEAADTLWNRTVKVIALELHLLEKGQGSGFSRDRSRKFVVADIQNGQFLQTTDQSTNRTSQLAVIELNSFQ